MNRPETPRHELGRILFTQHEIERRVTELSREISRTYRETPITAVGVLKGAVFFLADLVRQIESPLTYDFFHVSSYGGSTEPEGEPELRLTTRDPLTDRHVLLVEDIVDTGHTLRIVQEAIRAQKPASLRTVVLLDKRERRQVEVPLDWVGFGIPNRFVVGYGLDHDEKYRNLPFVGVLKEEVYRAVR